MVLMQGLDARSWGTKTMADVMAHLLATYKACSGYILSAAVFGAVLLFNQWTFRSRWKSYPTQAEYLTAHPHSNRAGGVVCHDCGTKALRAGVSGRGGLYRCSWCETELFRVDRADREDVW
jgi:hypothetical protein